MQTRIEAPSPLPHVAARWPVRRGPLTSKAATRSAVSQSLLSRGLFGMRRCAAAPIFCGSGPTSADLAAEVLVSPDACIPINESECVAGRRSDYWHSSPSLSSSWSSASRRRRRPFRSLARWFPSSPPQSDLTSGEGQADQTAGGRCREPPANSGVCRVRCLASQVALPRPSGATCARGGTTRGSERRCSGGRSERCRRRA